MKASPIISLLLPAVLLPILSFAVGITPEQIYQPSIDWQKLVATWEILPDEDPLATKNTKPPQPSARTLMTLRKDGTCRIFNQDYPMGTDGLWTFEDQRHLSIALPGDVRIEHFVYGVKRDFMITRSPLKGGKDLLWSRVK